MAKKFNRTGQGVYRDGGGSTSRHTFVFVLCPAFSGSTVLYRLIGSSRYASTLFGHDNWAGEGQFVPSVRDIMRRQPHADPREGGWEDPRVEMPWPEIRRRWMGCWDTSKLVLVEKSPPNLLRAQAIAEEFGRHGEVCFVAMIRSPYSVRQKPEIWLTEARHQRRNVETLDNLVWTTYEELCADPEAVGRRITRLVPALGPLQAQTGGPVGDRTGRISSRNASTRSLVLHRNVQLKAGTDLMRFFGYELLAPGTAAWSEQDWLPEIEVRSTVGAPPGEVYRHWVDPGRLERWWGRARTEPRVGGEYAMEVYPREAAPQGRAPVMSGRYLDLGAGRSLRFTWRHGSEDYLTDEFVVEVGLEPVGLASGGESGSGVKTTEVATAMVVRALAVPRTWYDLTREFWRSKVETLTQLLGAVSTPPPP